MFLFNLQFISLTIISLISIQNWLIHVDLLLIFLLCINNAEDFELKKDGNFVKNALYICKTTKASYKNGH